MFSNFVGLMFYFFPSAVRTSPEGRRMTVHIGGLLAIVVFYVLILLVGLWAARKSKVPAGQCDSEDVMLAGRNIGLLVGVFTMTGRCIQFIYV